MLLFSVVSSGALRIPSQKGKSGAARKLSQHAGISFDQVDYTFPSGRQLFNGLSFSISPGQLVCLVGENGCGKSTLAKLIAGELEPDSGHITSPPPHRIGYFQQKAKKNHYARVIDIYGEDIATRWTALQNINSGKATDEDIETVEDTWDLESRLEKHVSGIFGCRKIDFDAPMSHFSGGEAQLLRLSAIFFADDKDLFILDEPSNHIDQSGRRWLVKKLSNCMTSTILITHDRDLWNLGDKIIELSNLGIRQFGCDAEEFERQVELADRRASVQFDREIKKHSRLKREIKLMEHKTEKKSRQAKARANKRGRSKIENNFAKQKSQGSDSSKINRMNKDMDVSRLDLSLIAACQKEQMKQKFRLDGEKIHTKSPLVELDSVSLCIDGTHRILSDVNFLIRSQDRVQIKGSNGSGKSTLAKVLIGEVEPDSGSVHMRLGINDIAYIEQDSVQDDEHFDKVIVDYFNEITGLMTSQTKEHLASFSFKGDALLMRIGELSGGEIVRLNLASAFPSSPDTQTAHFG